jgi:hypothetical protein
MKMYEGVEASLLTFLISTLETNVQFHSPGCFTPSERSPYSFRMSRSGRCGKWEKVCLRRESNPEPFIPHRVTIPTEIYLLDIGSLSYQVVTNNLASQSRFLKVLSSGIIWRAVGIQGKHRLLLVKMRAY